MKQRQRNEEISQNDSSRLTYEIPDVINKSSNPCQLVNTVESPSQDYNQSLPHIINDDQIFKYVDVVVTEDGQQNLTAEYLSKERGEEIHKITKNIYKMNNEYDNLNTCK